MSDGTITGRVERVFVARESETLVSARVARATAAFGGFEGDKHAGWTRRADARVPWYPRGTIIRNERQVSIVSSEELARIALALGVSEVRAEWLGANLELSGVAALTLLAPRTRLVFSSGAVLTVEGENMPCRGPGRAIQRALGIRGIEARFPKAALGLRGVVATVELPGEIAEGDTVSQGT
jgi:hypothetical protein